MSRSLIVPLLLACSGENVITKQQNVAPTITIQSHGEGAEIFEGFVEGFRAQVSDADHGFAELEVAWYIEEQELCAWTAVTDSGESYCDLVFEPGDSSVVAEVRDPQGAGGRAELAITVLPTEAPTAEILEPPQADSIYYSDRLITFSALISDGEDDPQELVAGGAAAVTTPRTSR